MVRRILVCAFITLVAGIASPSFGQPTIPKDRIPQDDPHRNLIEALYSTKASERGDAARALGKLRKEGEGALPFLAAMLHDDGDWRLPETPHIVERGVVRFPVGRQVAIALGEIGRAAPEPALAVLLPALRDEKSLTRLNAAFALGEMRDARAVGPLGAALDDAEPSVRLAAVYALRRCGRAASDALFAALRNDDPAVRQAAGSGIAEVLGGEDVRSIEAAIILLHDQDAEIRARAAEGLGGLKTKDKRVTESLLAALTDTVPRVRISVSYALFSRRLLLDGTAVLGLVAALRDENESVRVNAAMTLGAISDRRATEGLLAALTDSAPTVRSNAAYSLGALKDAAAVEPLLATLKDESEVVRRAAVHALGDIKDPRTVDPLIATLSDKAAAVRVEAGRVLGEIGDARAVEPLIATLKDENEAVRRAAVLVVGGIKDPRILDPLIATLSDKAAAVCGNAVYILGAIGDARAVEPLIHTLLTNENFGNRRSAARSLDKLDDLRALGPLAEATADREEKVRIVAAPVLTSMTVRHAREDLGQWYVWWAKNRARLTTKP